MRPVQTRISAGNIPYSRNGKRKGEKPQKAQLELFAGPGTVVRGWSPLASSAGARQLNEGKGGRRVIHPTFSGSLAWWGGISEVGGPIADLCSVLALWMGYVPWWEGTWYLPRSVFVPSLISETISVALRVVLFATTSPLAYPCKSFESALTNCS